MLATLVDIIRTYEKEVKRYITLHFSANPNDLAFGLVNCIRVKVTSSLWHERTLTRSLSMVSSVVSGSTTTSTSKHSSMRFGLQNCLSTYSVPVV